MCLLKAHFFCCQNLEGTVPLTPPLWPHPYAHSTFERIDIYYLENVRHTRLGNSLMTFFPFRKLCLNSDLWIWSKDWKPDIDMPHPMRYVLLLFSKQLIYRMENFVKDIKLCNIDGELLICVITHTQTLTNVFPCNIHWLKLFHWFFSEKKSILHLECWTLIWPDMVPISIEKLER